MSETIASSTVPACAGLLRGLRAAFLANTTAVALLAGPAGAQVIPGAEYRITGSRLVSGDRISWQWNDPGFTHPETGAAVRIFRNFSFAYDPTPISSTANFATYTLRTIDFAASPDIYDTFRAIDCVANGFAYDYIDLPTVQDYVDWLEAKLNAAGQIRVEAGDTARPVLVFCGVTEVDTDGDGVPDAQDKCPDSDLGPTVSIGGTDTGVLNLWGTDDINGDGCTLADEIACALGQAAAAATAPDVKGTKGIFTAAMAQFLDGLVEDGIILEEDQNTLQAAVASLTLFEIASLEVPTWCQERKACRRPG